MTTTPWTAIARQLGLCAVFALFSGAASAGDTCCTHCGCECECQKICRLECTEKKITSTCWTYKTEDFCVPGPSQPGCAHCDFVCEECNEQDGFEAAAKFRFWREWTPSRWSVIYTKKKLMKKIVTKTVPSYKWVVEDLCPECEAGYKTVQVPAGAEIPPAPPLDDAKIIAVERLPLEK